MNRSELVEAVASETKLPKNQVGNVLEEVVEQISSALSRGERIDLRGFGVFTTRESAAREGRNPQTGDSIHIPARRAPTFRPSRDLKARCNP